MHLSLSLTFDLYFLVEIILSHFSHYGSVCVSARQLYAMSQRMNDSDAFVIFWCLAFFAPSPIMHFRWHQLGSEVCHSARTHTCKKCCKPGKKCLFSLCLLLNWKLFNCEVHFAQTIFILFYFMSLHKYYLGCGCLCVERVQRLFSNRNYKNKYKNAKETQSDRASGRERIIKCSFYSA